MNFGTKFEIGDIVICNEQKREIDSIKITKFGEKDPEVRYGFKDDILYYKEEWISPADEDKR